MKKESTHRTIQRLLPILFVLSYSLVIGCGDGRPVNTSPGQSAAGTSNAEGADTVPEGPHPRLKLAVDTFDFGSYMTGETLEKRIEYQNVGTAALEISKAIGVGSRIAVDVSDNTILPGNSGELVIRYDTRDQSGAQRRRVVVISNDPVQPRQYISFTANLEMSLGIQPRRVWFGTVSTREAVEKQFQIAGSRVKNVNPMEIQCIPSQQSEAVSFRVEDTRNEPAGGITVHIMLNTPIMEPGQFNIPVEVISGLSELDPLNLILNGTVTGPLKSEPSRIYFGRYTPGTPITQQVVIQHSENTPFSIVKAESDNALFAVTELPEGRARKQILNIRFQAAETDDSRNRALLTVETDLPKHGTITVPMYAFRKVPKH